MHHSTAPPSQDKCASQERQLAEQAQALEAQRSQLRVSNLASLDPQALSDRLLALVKEAFAAAAAERSSEIDGSGMAAPAAAAAAPSAPPPLAMSEEVVAALSRSLTSCCRELVFASKGLGGKQAAAEAPSVIPVQCC